MLPILKMFVLSRMACWLSPHPSPWLPRTQSIGYIREWNW